MDFRQRQWCKWRFSTSEHRAFHFHAFCWTPVTAREGMIHPAEAASDKTATDNFSVSYKCIKITLAKTNQVWHWPEDNSGKIATS